jgi:FKBP-type peptidyl-prolyl cis-trans isomerase
MRRGILIILLCVGPLLGGCGGGESSSQTGDSSTSAKADGAAASTESKPKVEVPSGPPPKKLVEKELVEGSGPAAGNGDEITFNYTAVDYETGKQIGSSWGTGQPYDVKLGSGKIIPGWDRGMRGMKVGGRRELIVPPRLAYGATGIPPTIPSDATLVFVVDLLSIK